MLKDRAKKKAKARVKSKAKSKVREAARDEGGPKVLKAAAVGGTAYYAGKKVHERRQEDEAEADQAQPAPAPTADAGTDPVAKLQQLADMHESGLLTDDEFAAAKQRLLAGE